MLFLFLNAAQSFIDDSEISSKAGGDPFFINNILCYKKDRKSVSLSLISQNGVVMLCLFPVGLADMNGLIEKYGGIINYARDKDMVVYEMSIKEEIL